MSEDVPKKTGARGKNSAFLKQAGKGRPKGVPNKATILAKNAIAEVADRIGGVDRMAEWVKEDPDNERVFWGSIYPKLLPLQLSNEGGGPVIFQLMTEDRAL